MKAGADVVALDPWADHVHAIQNNGLNVKNFGQDICVPLTATTSCDGIGTCDIIMFFVKYGQTTAAAQRVAPLITSDTLLVTLQNGIGNPDLIAEQYPNNPIVYGLTTLTSEMQGPGQIEASFAGRGETYFWRRGGAADGREDYLRDLLNAGALRCRTRP